MGIPYRGDIYLGKGDYDVEKMRRDPEPGYEYDLDDGGAVYPEGNARLEGAVFAVVNDNDGDVLSPVTGELVPRGEVVCTIVTDEHGYASTKASELNGWSAPDGWHGALAYGSYKVREVDPPYGYNRNEAWVGTVFVNGDGAYAAVDGDPLVK